MDFMTQKHVLFNDNLCILHVRASLYNEPSIPVHVLVGGTQDPGRGHR